MHAYMLAHKHTHAERERGSVQRLYERYERERLKSGRGREGERKRVCLLAHTHTCTRTDTNCASLPYAPRARAHTHTQLWVRRGKQDAEDEMMRMSTKELRERLQV